MTLPLSTWVSAMGLHPWHSHQFADTAIVPLVAACPTLVFERAWQAADRVGRSEIRQAIAEAERQIRTFGGFWPTPTEMTVIVPAGGWTVVVPECPIHAIGPATSTLLAAAASVTYTDLDGDGLSETATVTVTVPTDATELRVFNVPGDLGPATAREIVPRSVVVTGTTATITCDTWALARPVLYERVTTTPLNPTIVPPAAGSPLVASLQIWATTRTSTVTAIWDPTVATTGVQRDLPATVLDAEAGIVQIAAAGCPFSRPPDRVRVALRAGLTNHAYDLVVARLATAILARPVCGCDGANKELYTWQQDLSRTGATNELFAAVAALDNPLGTRRGHVYAWSCILRDQRLRGVKG